MGSELINGIGTYKERTLHAALKRYFEPDEAYHEQRYKGFIADILRDDDIIEIQTRAFNNLRRKLECFLPDKTVTVVYPAVRAKWLCWIDPQSGEISKRRRSPKTGKPYEAFIELYKIKVFLNDPHFRLNIVMVDVEEYRNLDGWSNDKKKGSHRVERIPVGIGEKIEINSTADYIKLIPEELPEKFTSQDFKKASSLSISAAQTALNVLSYVGAVSRVGKQGNRIIYTRATDEDKQLKR